MIWSNLTAIQHKEIIDSYLSGSNVHEVADKYNLNPSSLSRKIRLLKERGEIIVPRVVLADQWRRLSLTIEKPAKVLLYSDFHGGYSDPLARKAVVGIRQLWNPDIVFNLGDTLDAYSVSRFVKNPEIFKTLQAERDEWGEFAEELHDGDHSSRYILVGNHDRRYELFLNDNPSISDLEGNSLSNILMLNEFGYSGLWDEVYVNPQGDSIYPDAQLYLVHGSLARKQAGASSRGESENRGYASVIQGHTHKTGTTIVPTHRGLVYRYEIGCLQSLTPSYAQHTTWSQSVMVGYIGNGVLDLRHVIIDRGTFVLNGERYSV